MELQQELNQKIAQVSFYMLCSAYITRVLILFVQKRAMMEQESANQAGTGTSMEVIEGEFQRNKQTVIEMLIQNCMTVDTSIPRVVRGKFEEGM